MSSMREHVVERASKAHRSEWNRFVAAQSAATDCHLWQWKDVFERAYGKSCIYLFSVDPDDGAWSGVLPLVHMKGWMLPSRLVSLPFLDRGGILATSDAARRALLDAAFALLEESGAASLELRNGELPPTDEPVLETERYRFVLELPESEEALWQAVGGKVRNQTRKSRREGLRTRRAPADELPRFYSMFARNMRDLGSPAHSRGFFEEILRSFGDHASLYLTSSDEGRLVSGGVAVRFADSLIVPWASSLRSALGSCPNHSLYWQVLEDARAAGIRRFDFGRSSLGTGTYQFKKQWQGEAVPLVWTSFDAERRRRPEDHLSADRNPWLAGVWRRLPLWLASSLGPHIRKHLSN